MPGSLSLGSDSWLADCPVHLLRSVSPVVSGLGPEPGCPKSGVASHSALLQSWQSQAVLRASLVVRPTLASCAPEQLLGPTAGLLGPLETGLPSCGQTMQVRGITWP